MYEYVCDNAKHIYLYLHKFATAVACHHICGLMKPFECFSCLYSSTMAHIALHISVGMSAHISVVCCFVGLVVIISFIHCIKCAALSTAFTFGCKKKWREIFLEVRKKLTEKFLFLKKINWNTKKIKCK